MVQTGSYNTTSLAYSASTDFGRRAFFSMITRDDRGSWYQTASRTGSGQWETGPSFRAATLERAGFDSARDWYVTVNGFSSKFERTANRCRQVNVLKYDVDFHGSGADHAYECAMMAAMVEASAASGALPEPSMVVDTGRGLQLYWALERSTACRLKGGAPNERGLAYLHDVEKRLAGALKAVVEAYGSGELDLSVTSDVARVMRIPGTVNQANGRTCAVVADTGRTWRLADLANALPAPERRDARSRGAARMMRFDHLSLSRMKKIEHLQDYRGFGCAGRRELMGFCYYNAAVQVYADRDDAYQLLVDFNERFLEPLDERELASIRSSVDKVGFYKMRADTISSERFLGMRADEIEATRFFESARATARAAAKAKTAEKRAARDALIAELYSRPGATHASVAEAVGCSPRTVAAVLKDAERAAQSMRKLADVAREALEEKAATAAVEKPCKKLADVFSCSPVSTIGGASVGGVSAGRGGLPPGLPPGTIVLPGWASAAGGLA